MSLLGRLQHIFGYSERQLIRAASQGDLSQIQALLADGADVNARREDGTALMLAAKGGHKAVVTVLCQQPGIDLNATAWDGATALMLASVNNHLDVVLALVAAGADINSPVNSPIGDIGTALMWASFAGRDAVVRALLAAGADVNAKAASGETALMWASHGLHIDVVEALIAGGADVNARVNQTGWTPLMFATVGASLLKQWTGGKEVVQALLNSGADVRVQSHAGHTALTLATGSGPHRELIESAGGHRPALPPGRDPDAKVARSKIQADRHGETAEIFADLSIRHSLLQGYLVATPG